MELYLKGNTPLFQQFDVGSTVGNQFIFEIELIMVLALLFMPCQKFNFSARAHAVGVVIIDSRYLSHIVLIFRGVEETREEAFREFSQSKGLGKGRQGHGQKTKTVDEFQCLTDAQT